jgi:hypothetical protein
LFKYKYTMKYHLEFKPIESIQPSQAESIRQGIEDILNLKVNLNIKKSKVHPNLEFIFLDCDGDFRTLTDALSGKIESIKNLGIDKVILWGLYDMSGQGNMEWTMEEIMQMASCGMHFCLSGN